MYPWRQAVTAFKPDKLSDSQIDAPGHAVTPVIARPACQIDISKEPIMKYRLNRTTWARLAAIAALPIMVTVSVLGQQQVIGFRDVQQATQQAQYQEKLQRVINDQAGYAANIVHRWEDAARTSNRWDENYATDLINALLKLQPDNLLAAGEAPSFEAMMRVLATGRPAPKTLSEAISPDAVGDLADDMVYTPVTPCRIADTRFAGGAIVANTTRAFDVDGSNFSAQGGSATGCGIPYGVAQAVVMNITATQPTGEGYFTAYSLASAQPLSSVLNWTAGQTIANTTIVPVWPGAGNDFNLLAGVSTVHAVIDVLGYYAAPVATALDCITVISAVTACAYNTWTSVDAACPSGRTATGGGYNTTEGSLGYMNVWLTSIPNGNGWRTWVDNQNSNGSRNIQTYVNCCRIPGR